MASVLLRRSVSACLAQMRASEVPARSLSSAPGPSAAPTGRPDRLYESMTMEIRAHQADVLRSYAYLTETASRELGVNLVLSEFEEEPHKTRKTLLKAAVGKSKHRVQYEFQTYFWTFTFSKLTESTKDTLLEYLQRNLPEGMGMKVTLTERLRWPDSISKSLQQQDHQ